MAASAKRLLAMTVGGLVGVVRETGPAESRWRVSWIPACAGMTVGAQWG